MNIKASARTLHFLLPSFCLLTCYFTPSSMPFVNFLTLQLCSLRSPLNCKTASCCMAVKTIPSFLEKACYAGPLYACSFHLPQSYLSFWQYNIWTGILSTCHLTWRPLHCPLYHHFSYAVLHHSLHIWDATAADQTLDSVDLHLLPVLRTTHLTPVCCVCSFEVSIGLVDGETE
jgi:hypothetical protein